MFHFRALTLLVGRQERNPAWRKTGCWFVVGDIFDWSLLAPVVTTTFITLSSNGIQNGDLLVPANPGLPGKWSLNRERERDFILVIHASCILICYQVQTNLSARLVNVHSLSSTSLLNLLILTILARNVALLRQRRNYLNPLTYWNVLDLIKETHFYNKL